MSRQEQVVLSVRFPHALIQRIDELVAQGLFLNRNDLIREAVRQLLIKYNNNDNSPVLGVR